MVETYVREENICGVGPWVWIKGETGAWEGPSKEFKGLSDLCLKHARGRSLIVQAGGCQGMYPRLWAEHFERVVTVEPDPDNFSVLVQNCPGEKYTRINGALWDDPNAVSVLLYKFEDCNVGMHSVTRINAGRPHFPVPTHRIDDMKLDALDVIQLDVEGAEIFALRGAEESIARWKPVIAVETLTGDTMKLLERHGYHEVGRNSADAVFATR